MKTLERIEQHIQRPGFFLSSMPILNWEEQVSLRPKENEVMDKLLAHNKQTNITPNTDYAHQSVAVHFFSKNETQIILDYVKKNRIKLVDLIEKSLRRAQAIIDLKLDIQTIDVQDGDTNTVEIKENSLVLYNLGKLHRRELLADNQIAMVPPLFKQGLSCSFMVWADKLSISVNGDDELKLYFLALWREELERLLYS